MSEEEVPRGDEVPPLAMYARALFLGPFGRLARRAVPGIVAAFGVLVVVRLVSAVGPAVGLRVSRLQLGRLLAAAAFVVVVVTAWLLRRRDRRRRSVLRSTAHGTARWGDPDDLVRPTGFILGEHKGRLLRWEGEGHLLTLAPTGSGKGIGAVLPNLLDYPGSVVVTDIKGENYAVTARFRRDDLRQNVQALDPFGLVGGTGRYNPLDLVDPRRTDAYDYARLIASMLVVAEPERQEPFWEDEAASLIAGMVLYVALVAEPADRHLGMVRHFLTLSEGDFARLLDAMAATEDGFGLVRRTANRIRQKDPRLLGGILAATHRHTEILDSPEVWSRVVFESEFRRLSS